MSLREEKEIMMKNELLIIEEMKSLLTHSPEDNLKWCSTKTDLIEMIHILYESSEVRDAYGVPVSFCSLVNRCFAILNVKVPSNPNSYVSQARNCKGQRRAPLLLRYSIGCFIM